MRRVKGELTLREAAARCRVSVGTIQRWQRESILPDPLTRASVDAAADMFGWRPLSETHPHIASEWVEGTGYLGATCYSPSTVSAGSKVVPWWQCDQGHTWQARVYDRTHGKGCPTCFHQRNAVRRTKGELSIHEAAEFLGLVESGVVNRMKKGELADPLTWASVRAYRSSR